MFISRSYYHGDAPSLIIVYVVLIIPWHTMTIFWLHIIITKCGFLFIDAEVLRSGNEQILDGLEEGVVIIGEAEKDILYYNNAATRRSSRKPEKSTLIDCEKPDVKDMIESIDKPMFAEVKKTIFDTTT